MLPAVSYIIVRDNLNSHKLADAKMEAKRLGIGLVFLPSCSQPESNRIHQKKGYLNDLCKARE